jgi:multiple sugar transport system ATP-binding protein
VKVDVVESLGSERYVHFTMNGDRTAAEVQLAQENGGAEFGRSDQEIALVARVGADSRVRQNQEAQLWVDTTRLHLFDPKTGRNLVVSDGDQPAGGTS